MNNKYLFNSTNSLINNFNTLCGLVESVQQNIVNNNIKNVYSSCSNNSINFNSLSLNNNEFGYNSNCKENNLDYIVENIEKKEESLNDVDDKDEIIDFFKFDLVRKISKNDVKWDNKYYNIWNPDISSVSDFDEMQIMIKKKTKIQLIKILLVSHWEIILFIIIPTKIIVFKTCSNIIKIFPWKNR